MSLLDKISGLAQKAKENVISKTFISKDKRLEQSLSDNFKLNEFYFEKVSTYGLPSSISLVAFDCIAGLLAVADDLNSGYIKVFGKGLASTIRLPKPFGIKYIQFRLGLPILIIIDKANTIVTVDLRTKSVRHALPAPAIITSQTYCIGTDWLFVGYENGYVDVFDILEGTMTPYQIPDLLEADQEGNTEIATKNHVVVDLQMHPTELNTLLIGYESVVFIWNVRESTIRRSFSLRKLDKSNPYRDANLTCFSWSPKGSRFIGGYDDGSIHIWDVKNEQKPAVSRKLSETFFPTGSDQEVTEPIYQISWYVNDTIQKSFVVVAGGLNSNDIRGLNILEFDMEGDSREPKKQTIMPLPTDLSHFYVLSHDPYLSGTHNPFGIAVVSVDHSLNVYSLEHGFPLLKLPPALEFIDPIILNACHIPKFPEGAFKKLTGITAQDRNIHYLPLTGGVAGPEHVYHVDSNDLLVTIHKGEVVRFWDASYTGLRPLSHLTIHCLDNLESKDAFLCCIDVNKTTGAFSIGFSDGTILIYEYQGDPKIKPDIDPRLNNEFINNCDDTLKEISGLLEDMEADVEAPPVPDKDSKNPFFNEQNENDKSSVPIEPVNSPSPTHQQAPLQEKHEASPGSVTPPLPPRKQHKSCSFEKIKKLKESAGFYASLKVVINSPIRSIISLGESILAAATVNGTLYVMDTQNQAVLFSHNIASSDYHNFLSSVPKTEAATELQEADPNKEEDQKPPYIATLDFFNTYSPSKVLTVSTQLFVGLSNGHIYQFDLSSLEKGLAVTQENLGDYLTLQLAPTVSISEMHIIDLKGNSQAAITKALAPVPEELLTKKMSKESSRHSSDSGETDENSPKPSSVTSNSSSSTTSANVPSKRMAVIGKGEYKQQDNPHFIITVSPQSISVYLSGYNVKLFFKQLSKEIQVTRSEIIKHNESVCLCLLLNNGKLAFYSVPALEPLLEIGLPNNCLLDRLQEASLSSDGRVVFWTGNFEMEQFSFVHKPNFAIGESVILFDSQKIIPPHPSLAIQTQKAKKSWLDTVAGAFQREPLTLPELDLLMGRVPQEDPNEIRRQKMEAYKAKVAQSNETSSKGPGGVFSQLGQQMNERGERLNELDKKFEDMNAASGDFLKAVKEFNDRQTRKKWWEF